MNLNRYCPQLPCFFFSNYSFVFSISSPSKALPILQATLYSISPFNQQANLKAQLDKATKNFDNLTTLATKAEAKATDLKAKVIGVRVVFLGSN